MIGTKKKIVFWFITLAFPFILMGIFEFILYFIYPDHLKSVSDDPFISINSPD